MHFKIEIFLVENNQQGLGMSVSPSNNGNSNGSNNINNHSPSSPSPVPSNNILSNISDTSDSEENEKDLHIMDIHQVLRDLEAVGANNRSHDLDRQLLTVQQLIDVITQEELQFESPYSEEDDVHTWGRVSILIGRLLSSGVRAAKRSVTFTTMSANDISTTTTTSAVAADEDDIVYRCKFRDERTSSLVENCIVAAHTLATLPYVASSMNVATMKTFLVRMGRAKGSLSNNQFFTQCMTPAEDSWPDKMADMIMQTTLLYAKQACDANNDVVVAQSLMELLLEAEPRVPVGGNLMLLSPQRHHAPRSNSSKSASGSPRAGVGRSFHMADDAMIPPPSPMRTTMPMGDMAASQMTPPSSPSSFSSSFAPPPLARFVIEVVDELIQPMMYGGVGGPAQLFGNLPMSEFLKILSSVYKQNRLECVAACDALLEYTAQCRHEEMLLVVSLLSPAQESSLEGNINSSAIGRPKPDELEIFTMGKIQETAEYWRNVEIVVIRVQRWYREQKGWKKMDKEE